MALADSFGVELSQGSIRSARLIRIFLPARSMFGSQSVNPGHLLSAYFFTWLAAQNRC